MVLSPTDAQRFIRGFSVVMLEVLGGPKRKFTGDLLPWLAKGREKLTKKPLLLEKAKSSLESRSVFLDSDVYLALQSLDVRRWVYLRDTKRHSIFIDPSADRAYGVVGLTQRIREVVGGSGVLMETGLVRYAGHMVCDGLIAQQLWLGASYRRSFDDKLHALKAEGKFYL